MIEFAETSQLKSKCNHIGGCKRVAFSFFQRSVIIFKSTLEQIVQRDVFEFDANQSVWPLSVFSFFISN